MKNELIYCSDSPVSLRRAALKAALSLSAGWLAGSCGLAAAKSPDSATPPSPAQRESSAPPLPEPGSALVLPQLDLLGGGVFRPDQAKGQITVLYWWASTCPFCAEQSPEMQKLWQANQGRGLQLLTLSVDRTADEARAYLRKKSYTFPSIWVNAAVHQSLPKPKGLPVTVVLGRDGRVIQADKGQMFAEDVAQLADLLSK